MTKDDQNLTGLEAAYKAVYKRPLIERVSELFAEYGQRVDKVACEINPHSSVPAFWKVSELCERYGFMFHRNSMVDIPSAACGTCGGWTSQGGMSQHSNAIDSVMGRTGCDCHTPNF